MMARDGSGYEVKASRADLSLICQDCQVHCVRKRAAWVGECGEQQQDIKLPSLFAHILTFAPPVVSLNTTNCPIFSFTVSEIRHLSKIEESF